MADADCSPKLTTEQQQAVIEWLCEGLRNVEVVAALKDEYGVEVSQQAIDYYRTAHADEIGGARTKALQKAAQQGFANRIRRIRSLERKAEKMDEVLDGAAIASWPNWLVREYRETLREIRDELGDLKQRHELTGADGGDLRVQWWEGEREGEASGDD